MDREKRRKISNKLYKLTYRTASVTKGLFHHFLPDKKFVNPLIWGHLRALEDKYDIFAAAVYWPVRADEILSLEEPTSANLETAIILQGPLMRERDFTLETVKIYNKIYPGAAIIVSTWENEDPQYIERIKSEADCEIILNKYPENPGIRNVNYQITSTMGGMRSAAELGKTYAMKTRTDQRFLKFNMIDVFVSLLNRFPVSEGVEYQKQRIISFGGHMFMPGFVADQFGFGSMCDMLNYWNFTLSTNGCPEKPKNKTWRQLFEEKLSSEKEILCDYIRRNTGRTIRCNVREHWNTIKSQFIIFGHDELNYYWPKYDVRYDYSARVERYRFVDDMKHLQNYTWNFGKWLALYEGRLKYKEEYEAFPDRYLITGWCFNDSTK